MNASLCVALDPEGSVSPLDDEGCVDITGAMGSVKLSDKRGVLEWMSGLVRGPEPVDHLRAVAVAAHDLLEGLLRIGAIQLQFRDESRPVLIAYARTGTARLSRADIPPSRVRLSSFAHLRREDGVVRLLSARSRMAIDIDPAFDLRAVPLQPRPPRGATDDLLLLCGMLDTEVDGVWDEETDPDLLVREPHDLEFQLRSRRGVRGARTGGTYRVSGLVEPLPAVPTPGTAGSVLLAPHVSWHASAPLLTVMANRRSIRTHASNPIRIGELATFLHRVAVVTESHSAVGANYALYETTRRPYPSAGAAYDLDIYLVVRECTGLQAGLYRYDPLEERLDWVQCRPSDRDELLSDASHSMGTAESPQILVVLASRFARTSWKYETIALSLTLKNVGALMATMYLVATDLELAACAIGSGNAGTFARMTDTDPLVMSSVGEFALGSRVAARSRSDWKGTSVD